MSQWTIGSGLDSNSKALIFCFWSSSSANLKMSCRFETLQDLSLFFKYGLMMPSIKLEATIMLPGSVGVRGYAYSTKLKILKCTHAWPNLFVWMWFIYVWPLWNYHTLKIFPVREVSLQTNVNPMNAALSHIYGVIPLKLLKQHFQDLCRKWWKSW